MGKYMKIADNGTVKLSSISPLNFKLMPKHLLCFVAASMLCLLSPGLTLAEENTIDEPRHPDVGWQVSGTGLRLGGYASAGLENEQHAPWRLGIDDLSLFVTWENDGKLKLFSELDLEDPLIYTSRDGLTSRYAYLALERAYGDYLQSEYLNFRAGKFLTPIGRWNVIHAAPLVWTTSRPLITEHSFPTNATGAMVYGTFAVLGQDIDYSLYKAFASDWRTARGIQPFKHAYGLHLNLPAADYGELGFSYACFEQEEPPGVPEGPSEAHEQKRLYGLDYFWSRNRYELSAELIYRQAENTNISEEKGLFVQGVMPLSERWYGIARYEWYDQIGPADPLHLGVIGAAMRITPTLIFKAEYSAASHNRIQAPTGLYTSFAILF